MGCVILLPTVQIRYGNRGVDCPLGVKVRMRIQRPPSETVEALKPVFFVSDIGFVAAPGTGHEPSRITFLPIKNRHGRNLRSFSIDVSGPARRTTSGSVTYGLCRTPPMSFMY